MNQTNVELLRRPITVSVVFFIISAILGFSMRTAFVIDMPEWFNYKHVQHGHSHVALLGWLFGIYYIIIIRTFHLDWRRYSTLFWALQVSVLGMLITFPLYGYVAISIIFSTLHILLSYIFVYKIWKEGSLTGFGILPALFLKTSLFFLVLSTIGTWALGPIMATGLKGSAIYYAAIQFYLHFQFNGWFIFAVIAIFLAMLHSYGIDYNNRFGRLSYWSLAIGTVLTYALAVTWSTPLLGIFMINSIGVIFQLIALILFLKILLDIKSDFKKKATPYIAKVLFVALIAFSLKVLIQSAVVIPSLAEVSYSIRNFIIGFIHLLMLGGLSLYAFSMISKILSRPLSMKGTVIFIFGVMATEFLLFLQGFMQWQKMGFMKYYYEMIATFSLMIIIGLAFLLIDLIRTWVNSNIRQKQD